MTSSTGVVIAIPTFRRPRGLADLLEAIAAIPAGVRVVVADNDAERKEGTAVVGDLVARSYPHPLEAIEVADRGIAQVRNALVSHIIAAGEAQFIVMIDDDERPRAGWLQALLGAQAQTGAQVVGGPVARRFEVPVPTHLERANNHNPGQYPTGPVAFVDATSNVLFDASVFREIEGPWFDPFFALTGGEDKDFMTALRLRGKTFAWCDEAQVEETFPASRCSVQWAVRRAFSTGNSDMLVNLRRRPPEFGFAGESAKIAGALMVAAVNLTLLAFDPARRFYGMRLGARVAGKLVALFGYRHLEYRTVHGR